MSLRLTQISVKPSQLTFNVNLNIESEKSRLPKRKCWQVIKMSTYIPLVSRQNVPLAAYSIEWQPNSEQPCSPQVEHLPAWQSSYDQETGMDGNYVHWCLNEFENKAVTPLFRAQSFSTVSSSLFGFNCYEILIKNFYKMLILVI